MHKLAEIVKRFGAKMMVHRLAHAIHKDPVQKARHNAMYKYNLFIYLQLTTNLRRMEYERTYLELRG